MVAEWILIKIFAQYDECSFLIEGGGFSLEWRWVGEIYTGEFFQVPGVKARLCWIPRKCCNRVKWLPCHEGFQARILSGWLAIGSVVSRFRLTINISTKEAYRPSVCDLLDVLKIDPRITWLQRTASSLHMHGNFVESDGPRWTGPYGLLVVIAPAHTLMYRNFVKQICWVTSVEPRGHCPCWADNQARKPLCVFGYARKFYRGGCYQWAQGDWSFERISNLQGAPQLFAYAWKFCQNVESGHLATSIPYLGTS